MIKQIKKTPTRIITVGSMQKRFDENEEVLILDGDDTLAKVIMNRLFNSQYCDLDFKKTIEGVSYIVAFLISNGVTSYTLEERVAELLSDGTTNEKYKGAL